MPTAYEGHEPYIFISYSHRDSDFVLSSIDALQKSGFRVWFDGGIEAGSEWPEYIASHLKNSACVLTFISDNFVQSDNCRRELNFAQDLRKPMLNVYIHDVALSDGMRMQLGLNQALKRFNFAGDAEFNRALCGARLLKECGTLKKTSESSQTAVKAEQVKRDDSAVKTETVKKSEKADGAFVPITTVKKVSPTPPPSAQTVKKEAPKSAPAKIKSSGHPVLKGLVNWTGILLELSYAYFGTAFMSRLTENYTGFWKLFLWMLVPHAAISVLIVLLYRTLGRPLTSDERKDISPFVFACWVLSSILAVIVGTFYCHLNINIVLKFLLVLGLNIIPALFSVVMMLKCDY